MKPLFVLLLTLGGASASIITLDPGASIGAFFAVTPSDYLSQPPSPGGMFEDLLLEIRDNFGPPPLYICCANVHQIDTIMGVELPANIYAYAATVPRLPATYHVDIANTGASVFTFDSGKLVQNPEPGTWLMLAVGTGVLLGFRWRKRGRGRSMIGPTAF